MLPSWVRCECELSKQATLSESKTCIFDIAKSWVAWAMKLDAVDNRNSPLMCSNPLLEIYLHYLLWLKHTKTDNSLRITIQLKPKYLAEMYYFCAVNWFMVIFFSQPWVQCFLRPTVIGHWHTTQHLDWTLTQCSAPWFNPVNQRANL